MIRQAFLLGLFMNFVSRSTLFVSAEVSIYYERIAKDCYLIITTIHSALLSCDRCSLNRFINKNLPLRSQAEADIRVRLRQAIVQLLIGLMSKNHPLQRSQIQHRFLLLQESIWLQRASYQSMYLQLHQSLTLHPL